MSHRLVSFYASHLKTLPQIRPFFSNTYRGGTRSQEIKPTKFIPVSTESADFANIPIVMQLAIS